MDKYRAFHDKFKQNLWCVSTGAGYSLDHIEMSIHVGKREGYILDRLEREKRCGWIEIVDEHTYKFVADVYDVAEMLIRILSFGPVLKVLEPEVMVHQIKGRSTNSLCLSKLDKRKLPN